MRELLQEPTARIERARGGSAGRLGAYLLLERLGVGGMATVHRARRVGDPDARDVAIKRLHPHLVDNANAIASFVKEVRVGCMLDHPVIRRVFNLCREGDDLFMVMEYVDGWSLRSLLERCSTLGQPLTMRSVLAVLHQLCRALQYAHELVDETGAPTRFVHRDVSPSNLIVSTNGRLKLIDMGVARVDVGALETRSGHIKGKYGYMAPEVLDAVPFDRRADVYSVGVVAWELITLCKLFPVRNPPVDVDRVRARPVEPPSLRNRACPTELDAIVLRAVAAAPADRWQSCGAMADALGEVARTMGEPIPDHLYELTEVFAETTVSSAPPVPFYRPRLARGTTMSPSIVSVSPSVSRVGTAPRARRWGSVALGAVVGSLATVVGVTHDGEAVSAAGPPSPSWADHSVAYATPDAGVGADARVGPNGALIVDESAVTRIAGPWPGSRSASYPYRARVCIDADGDVVSVTMLGGPERLQGRITNALMRWRYAPYLYGGAGHPACFEVASRVRKLPRSKRR